MPTVNITVKSAEKVWSSPDGKITIFKLDADYQGQSVAAKTYSKEIATPGWVGEVEVYEKPQKDGSSEQFVRQLKKENSYGGGYSKGGGRQSDPFTMYLSYAKDLAVACVEKGVFNDTLYGQLLDAAQAGGQQLYEGRPDHKEKQTAAKPEDKATEIEDVDNNDIAEAVDKVFGKDEGDQPWQAKLPT